METVKGYHHREGTLAIEFITLPDGTRVTKKYDKTGVRTTEEKYYRKDGTLQMKKEYNEKGQWVTIKYDKTGKNPIRDVQSTDEIRELVKSAELLSNKRKKYHITSIWKERE